MKILINNIDKKHKIEKTKKQREEEENKNDKLIEKIEKRKNRVYLYPRSYKFLCKNKYHILKFS